MLSRDQIKRAHDRPREWVPLPEWAEEGQDPATVGVWVGTMSARQQDLYDQLCYRLRGDDAPVLDEEAAGDSSVRALVAVFTCQNEDGSLFFEEADRHWLANKGAPPLSRILNAAVSVNQMRRADSDDAKKNSAATPTNSSNTASPSPSA